MRKLLTIIITFCILISLTGCTKVINVKYQDVEVKVVDEYYRGMFVQPLHVGKVTTMIAHPAEYRITVEYEGIQYKFIDKETHDKYKDKLGQNVTGTLEILSYDDGSIRHDIVNLK